jgi:hypothetical protein
VAAGAGDGGDPGEPWENGFGTSFNSRFRDEFLEVEAFEDVADARAKGAWFRREYNTVRPHSSLGYQTPKEFREACAREQCGRTPRHKGQEIYKVSRKAGD